MLVDVHAHLDFEQFDKDREKVILESTKENIIIINSGLGPSSIKKTLQLSEKYENVFPTLGLGPQELDSETVNKTIELIKKNRDKIVGVGEVGLDYYWVKDKKKRNLEMENFEKFIQLSKDLELPLVIHSRDAEKDVINKLEEDGVGALLHCFGGNPKHAEKAISLDCIISIPTSIVYSKRKQKLVEKLPIESIVLETDAPFQSPKPKTRNHPKNIKKSIGKISEIKKLDKEVVEETTTKNARAFFKF